MSNQFQTINSFQLSFSKIPNCIINLQKCDVPSIQSTHVEIPTPFNNLRLPGTNQTFSPFSIQFKLDENLDSYLEIFNWMNGLGFPDSFEQFRQLQLEQPNKRVVSDAVLTTVAVNGASTLQFKFINMFPVYLSELNFDVTNVDPQYLDVQAMFMYDSFSVERVI